jgi:hypothetical protein
VQAAGQVWQDEVQQPLLLPQHVAVADADVEVGVAGAELILAVEAQFDYRQWDRPVRRESAGSWPGACGSASG